MSIEMRFLNDRTSSRSSAQASERILVRRSSAFEHPDRSIAARAHLCTSHGKRGELEWVEPNLSDPSSHRPRILPRGQWVIRTAGAREQLFPGLRPLPRSYASSAWRVTSLNSNRTGRPVFLWRTLARSTA
jgi:hypothetical protein